MRNITKYRRVLFGRRIWTQRRHRYQIAGDMQVFRWLRPKNEGEFVILRKPYDFWAASYSPGQLNRQHRTVTARASRLLLTNVMLIQCDFAVKAIWYCSGNCGGPASTRMLCSACADFFRFHDTVINGLMIGKDDSVRLAASLARKQQRERFTSSLRNRAAGDLASRRYTMLPNAFATSSCPTNMRIKLQITAIRLI